MTQRAGSLVIIASWVIIHLRAKSTFCSFDDLHMTHENKEPILNEVVLPLTRGMLLWYAPFWDRYAHCMYLSMLGSCEEEIVQVMIKDLTILFLCPTSVIEKPERSHGEEHVR